MEFLSTSPAIARRLLTSGTLPPGEAAEILGLICYDLESLGVTAAEVTFSGPVQDPDIGSIDFSPAGADVPADLRGVLAAWAAAVIPEDWGPLPPRQGLVTVAVSEVMARVESGADHVQIGTPGTA